MPVLRMGGATQDGEGRVYQLGHAALYSVWRIYGANKICMPSVHRGDIP